MATNKPQIDNLTETVQSDLGIQQAQTFAAEDVVADAIARLVQQRGNLESLRRLWTGEDKGKLIAGYQRGEHDDAAAQLRHVLELNLVVQRGRDGLPKTMRPLVPELISHERTSTVFRDHGKPVVDVVWRDLSFRAALKTRVESWRTRHPLAIALAPLCTPVKPTAAQNDFDSKLGALVRGSSDPELNEWVDRVVVPDWHTWLKATEQLGVDEQLETMVSLTCLHLHLMVLWRLWGERSRPVVFVAVTGQEPERSCERAAYNSYVYWGDRAHHALRRAASAAIKKAREETPGFSKLTTVAELSSWAVAEIVKGRSANDRFQALVKEAVDKATGNFEEILVDVLIKSFETHSGVTGKVKDYLRGTGAAAGLVGPNQYRARKRYQFDDRLIELLVRLHVHRGNPKSNEEEPLSVDALLDDIFDRYGLVVTRDRPPIREALSSERCRAVVRLLPGEEAMRRNRFLLEQRLDELRLVRRYSDASAVLNVD